MLKNWSFVLSCNFIGSVFVAYMMNKSQGFLQVETICWGAVTINIAAYKVGLTHLLKRGYFGCILCNWLVYFGVWMSYGAKRYDREKIFAIFFPIWLFITSGFEHSIANMYYIPAGIMAKGNKALVDAAALLGVTAEKLSLLNWGNILLET